VYSVVNKTRGVKRIQQHSSVYFFGLMLIHWINRNSGDRFLISSSDAMLNETINYVTVETNKLQEACIVYEHKLVSLVLR
jgi:hypothetical protein